MIVLDTHALLWWASGAADQLSPVALDAIQTEMDDGRIVVSSISAWELAMLVARGRVALSIDTSEWLTLAGQMTAAEMAAVKGCIYGMIVAVDKRNE